MLLSKNIALEVINNCLLTGADFAEIYVQRKFSHNLALSHKRVDTCVSSLTYGASIRIMLGTKCVFGYTQDVSKKGLLDLADRLKGSFNGKQEINLAEFSKVKVGKKHQPLKPHDSLTNEQKIAYLKQGEQAIYAVSPLIINATCALVEWDEEIEVFNSKGAHVSDKRTRTRLAVSAVAGKNNEFQSAFEGPGGSVGLELLDSVDIVATGKKVAETALKLLSAPECPSGKMTVIIGNKFGGVLFHEACGHPLEGVAISHKTSVFSDKLGQQIASKEVTAIDDGTIDHGWGSSNFDDEGEVTTKNVLIKDGILTSFMMDNFEGRRMNRVSTGACRRQSYKYLPTTRMTNTYIANGKYSVEDMIKATKFGLYCVSFNGGSVDPSTDKFNFTASEAYIIKDGKIDHLVKDASLVGYGYEVLKNIDMVGNDLGRGQGMCGAASGSIPVDVGQPTLRVQNITVGGRGGKVNA